MVAPLTTDHKLVSFEINLKIERKPKPKRFVYDFAKANWSDLKEKLANTPWDSCFVPGNIDETLSNWCDMFLSAVDEHIPKYCIKNVYDHPWIDKEILRQIKKENILRKFALEISIYCTKSFNTSRVLIFQAWTYSIEILDLECVLGHVTFCRDNIFTEKKSTHSMPIISMTYSCKKVDSTWVCWNFITLPLSSYYQWK